MKWTQDRLSRLAGPILEFLSAGNEAFQCSDRGRANQWVGIGQGTQSRSDRRFVRLRLHPVQCGCSNDGWMHAARFDQSPSGLGRIRVILPGSSQKLREMETSRRAIGFRVPFLNMFQSPTIHFSQSLPDLLVLPRGDNPVRVLPAFVGTVSGGKFSFGRFLFEIGPVEMTLRAGIGRSPVNGEVGARDAEAMVMPGIHFHVDVFPHVATDAGGSRRTGAVLVMCRRVVSAGRMLVTGGTDLIARRFQSGRMRIMAITAANLFVVHLALHEAAVLVDFIQNLTIRKIG
jgi:hypothetical protein